MIRRTARTVVALLLGLVIAAHALGVRADTPTVPNAVVAPATIPCPYWMGCSDWKLIEINLTPFPVSGGEERLLSVS